MQVAAVLEPLQEKWNSIREPRNEHRPWPRSAFPVVQELHIEGTRGFRRRGQPRRVDPEAAFHLLLSQLSQSGFTPPQVRRRNPRGPMNRLPDSCDSSSGRGRGDSAATVSPRRSHLVRSGWEHVGKGANVAHPHAFFASRTVSLAAITQASAQIGAARAAGRRRRARRDAAPRRKARGAAPGGRELLDLFRADLR